MDAHKIGRSISAGRLLKCAQWFGGCGASDAGWCHCGMTSVGETPKLVYGRMTGWGQTGPLAERAGHDPNYIGLVGALHAIGRKDEQPIMPLSLVGDFGGGAMYLVSGIRPHYGKLPAAARDKSLMRPSSMVQHT